MPYTEPVNNLIPAYLFFIALALAYLEVQIEGPNGWAAKLPTWRSTKPWLLRLNSGKPVTGYHLALTATLLLFFHLPAFWTTWTWSKEALTMVSFLVFTIVWDYLWFVVNPGFGLRRYNRANVWWFKRWFLGVPVDYWFGLLISVALAGVAGLFSEWLELVAIMFGLAGIATIIGESIRSANKNNKAKTVTETNTRSS